jgi:hypothetical protein
MYHQFNLNREVVLRLAKRNFLIFAGIFLVVMGLFMFIPAVNTVTAGKTSVMPQIIIYAGIMLFSLWSSSRNLKKLKLLISSYSLVIKDDMIVRRIEGQEEMNVRFSDIKEIIQYKDGAFSVRSHNPAIRVQIPHNIERREELTELLAGIHPIKKAGFFTPDSKWSLLIVCLVGAAVICGITQENRVIVGIAGLVLLVFYVWVIYLIFIRKVVTAAVRKKSWLFILIFGFLLLNILVKLMGYYTPE